MGTRVHADRSDRSDRSDSSDSSDRSDRLGGADPPKQQKGIDAGRLIEIACAMAEAGVMMMEEKIRRENPGMDTEEVARRVRAWLFKRPGAEHGDTVGRYRPTHPLYDEMDTESE